MHSMRFLPKFPRAARATAGVQSRPPDDAAIATPSDPEQSGLLKTVGWISAALGAVALGLIVGREIRQRYKFNRRTPYDLYAHSGDELPDVECGVGI